MILFYLNKSRKKLVCLLLVAIAIKSGAQEKSLNIYQVDALEKVLKNRAYFDKNEQDTIRVARGENATVQLVVKANQEIKGLRAVVDRISKGKSVLPQYHTGWIGYVEVGRRYGNPSKDIIRSASNYFPDPILTDTTMDLDQNEIEPLWITVPIPLDAAPGLYQGITEVSGYVGHKRKVCKRIFYIRVYPVAIPQTSLWFTNWMSFAPDNLAYMNKGVPVDVFSPLYWQLLGDFARMAGSHGQNMYRIYPVWLTKYGFEDGKYRFDFSNFDKEVALFMKTGNLQRIEGGHLAWRSGKWTDPYFVEVPVKGTDSSHSSAPGGVFLDGHSDLHFENLPLSDERARNFLDQFLPALKDHLQEKGWLHRYIQHIADEPVDANAGSYKQISEYVKKYLPGVKLVDAVTASKSLQGSIDIWCPVLNIFDKDYAYFDSLRKSGKEIWFYTCVIPQGNYANRFIELPLVQTRMLPWIDYKYHAVGYLHWGFNFWSGIDDPMHEASRHRGLLPGGDCFIVYPGYHKLYSSIRLEAMRDGIDDYELLKKLQEKDPAEAQAIVSEVIFDFDSYDSETHHFREMRKRLLESLSE